MSGHSKWANIKRKKQANDLIKGNVFSKMSRLVTLAVLESGGITDPENNVKLRLAIDKAKQVNMPKENIKKAIEKGSGPDRVTLKEIVYEGFAPNGVALLILTTTDNSNRTLTEIKNILEKKHGNLGNQGSVSYLFKKCAYVSFMKKDSEEEKVFLLAQDLNAFDIDQDETHFFVFFPFENFGKLKDHLAQLKYEQAEIDYLPSAKVTIEDQQKVNQILSLVEDLEALDDVHKVFTNLN